MSTSGKHAQVTERPEATGTNSESQLVAAEGTVSPKKRTIAQRILGFLSSGIVNVLLVFVALFWLIPTIGLFITSLRSRGITPLRDGGPRSPNPHNSRWKITPTC